MPVIGVVKRGESWWYQMDDGTYHSGADGIVPYIRVVQARTEARAWAGMVEWIWADFKSGVSRKLWNIISMLKKSIEYPLYDLQEWLTRKLILK